MRYSDTHTAHALQAPHPSWKKSATCDHSFYKKIIFIVKKKKKKKVVSKLREA